jgi:hypothetical protein
MIDRALIAAAVAEAEAEQQPQRPYPYIEDLEQAVQELAEARLRCLQRAYSPR